MLGIGLNFVDKEDAKNKNSDQEKVKASNDVFGVNKGYSSEVNSGNEHERDDHEFEEFEVHGLGGTGEFIFHILGGKLKGKTICHNV